MNNSMESRFDLTGRVAIITGGLGLLGRQHGEAIAAAGGIPVFVDIVGPPKEVGNSEWNELYGSSACAIQCDITKPTEVEALLAAVLKRYGRVDILINNAANNPRPERPSDLATAQLETFSKERWDEDLAVGLTGAFLCSQIIGREMAARKRGVIVNIGSDYANIAPDQRLYHQKGLPDDQQPVKPITYSVVKTGIIGLTRYLATYWATSGVRVNTLSPGGVENGQSDEFISRISDVVPLGRMASKEDYQGAILFLCSDASSYMTGTNLIVDGGRSCW